jgi:hypothetical protein
MIGYQGKMGWERVRMEARAIPTKDGIGSCFPMRE